LNVFPITIPPLRDRVDDIPLLIKWLVDRAAKKMGKKIKRIPSNAMNTLKQNDWPGNVRELQHVIERAVINSRGHVLRLADEFEKSPVESSLKPRRMTLAEMEQDLIYQALKDANWKIEGKNGAAVLLGINSSTLRGRMKKHGIHRSIKKKPKDD
jgi:transcriptional regulator with GAF, ATPase, and Fis domain